MKISRVLGSGYPGDPSTKTWLQQHFDPIFGFPALVRFSWQTCKTMLKEQGTAVDWGQNSDDEDENENNKPKTGINANGKRVNLRTATMDMMFSRIPAASSSPIKAGLNGNTSVSVKAASIPLLKRFKYFHNTNLDVATSFHS